MLDGLISDNINSICQDSAGYIWVATGEGLSSFNSRKFRNYTTNEGLISNNLNFVIADKYVKNKIWIGTNGKGISGFRDGVFENFGADLVANQNDITTIYQSKDSTIFCGSDKGFFTIKNKKVQFADSENIGSVNSFTEDNKNRIWIAAQTGLFLFDNSSKKINRINLPTDSNSEFRSLLNDKDGIIWAYNSILGLMFRIDVSGVIKKYNLKIHNLSGNLVEDDFRNIWITTNDGLYKFNKNDVENTLTKFTTDNGLQDNIITSILFDRENILWIATNDKGMSKLVYPNLFYFKNKNSNNFRWSTLSSDSGNHFWGSNENKLVEIWKSKNGTWIKTIHPLDEELRNEFVHNIVCDNKGNIYIASASGKILVYKIISIKNSASKLKKIDSINLKKISEGDKFYFLLIDNNNEIWCSILDLGIILLDKNNHNKIKEIYTVKDGIPDNSIRAIYQDSKNNFWFGGFDTGLSEFSYEKNNSNKSINFVKHFTTQNGLPNNDVRAILEPDSTLIIGTRYGALAIYKSGIFTIVNRENGLFSNAIWSIAKTKSQIWLGMQSGVQALQGNYKISYELYEEIPKEPFYSVASSSNGNLCFASSTDFYVYEPLTDYAKPYDPPVYLNHIFINGHERDLSSGSELSSNENTITFEFQGIVNRNQGETKYEYRLLNKNNGWTLLTNNNEITYSFLDPGIYTFQVEAVNMDNMRSRIPAQFTFKINSPFYRQWWFFVLLLVTGSILIYIFTRMKIKRIIEIEKIRTRIASDLHDEIGSGLTHIAMLSENLIRNQNLNNTASESDDNKYSVIKSMDKIGKISRNLVDSMIDVIWAIDPKYDSLIDFVRNFKVYAIEICETKNIEIIFEIENIEKIKVDSKIKRSLQLISKESLNNAIKYSECTIINYKLFRKNKTIFLFVEDNGKGFDPEHCNLGNGLKNIQKNAEEINGRYEIKSGENIGTQIRIEFSLNK